jgi:predicted O-linked N-acetylglucosamine transferase (SPINDLY family)
VKALNNQGNTFRDLQQFEQAQVCYRRALEFEPERAEIHFNLAVVLEEVGSLQQSLEHYLEALRLQPEQARYEGAIQHVRMLLCDWTDFDAALVRIAEALGRGRSAIDPFAALALFDRPQLHRIAAELFIRERFANKLPDSSEKGKLNPMPENRLPRIGYFSSDFHNHATMHLLLDVLKQHDKGRFEFFAFSFGPQTQDPWQQEARACFSEFFDVRDLSDAQVCELARRVGIDIAVDLKGFTKGARMGIFKERAAPLQLSFLGYPGTIGAAFMDHAIVDREVVPDGLDVHFKESLIYFPGCYQPNMRSREISKEGIKRTDHDLPENAVVFCCFNNLYKLTPTIFESWMTILRSVDAGVLWLIGSHEMATQNLKQRAESTGVRSDRIIFARYLPVEQHLNRLRQGDIFLDSFPYGAHTTASDALRMGVPLVTLRGVSFASRVASSILRELGLTELITDSLEEYTSLAIRLGSDPLSLKALKQRVLKATEKSRLFDSHHYSKELEAIYDRLLRS